MVVCASDGCAGHGGTQQWGQFEARWRGVCTAGIPDHAAPIFKQAWAIHANTGEGEFFFAIGVHHAGCAECKVAPRVVFRVVHQEQMRLLHWFTRQGGEIGIAPDIPIDREEWRIAQHGQRMPDAAAGFERGIAFERIRDA